MSRHVLLEGSSLQQLHERVLAEHGRHARIVSAERITSGGIKGFFAKQHFEVTVELPETADHGVHSMDLPTRVGLAALLDDADSAESTLADVSGPEPTRPSTATPDFAALLRQMTLDTATPAQPARTPELHVFPGLLPVVGAAFNAAMREPLPPRARAAAPSRAPELLTSSGDLVLCIGVRSDVARLGREWADASGSTLTQCVPAQLAPAARAEHPEHAGASLATVSDRRDAAALRAAGVERGTACLAVVELSGAQADADASTRIARERQLGTAASILADQVWLVVDVSRKADDTAAWVAACREMLEVHGIVAVGRSETSTPDSVHALCLPVLWHPKG